MPCQCIDPILTSDILVDSVGVSPTIHNFRSFPFLQRKNSDQPGNENVKKLVILLSKIFNSFYRYGRSSVERFDARSFEVIHRNCYLSIFRFTWTFYNWCGIVRVPMVLNDKKAVS